MSSTNPTDVSASGRTDAGYCVECGVPLSPGAKFCHRCGAAVDHSARIHERPASRAATLVPWMAAAVALTAVVAVLTTTNPPGSPSTPLADAPTGPAGDRLPDIGAMTPAERANRLYVRVMQYAEAGQTDSVARFAPMVLAAHEMLQSPSDDERYHFGRAAEVIGSVDIAKAQADTLLQHSPRSLLGLLLAARVARLEGRRSIARELDQRLLAALGSELATGNADYENHRAEIDRAVADARSP